MSRSRTKPLTAVEKTELKKICAEHNYDPLIEILRLLKKKKSKLTDSQKLDAHKTMMKHFYPELKAVEMSGQVDSGFHITIQKFGHMIEEQPLPPALPQTIPA
jgi:hypothetical protein